MFKFLRKRRQPKVLVVGLDCAAPHLVFDTWRDQLPNLRRLMENGTYECVGKFSIYSPSGELLGW